MQYYFAPLEGLTDRIFRRLHHRYFGGVDRYYLPFLSPTVHRALTPREELELPQADTLGYVAIPQLLTKNSQDFLWMADQCRQRGYTQVDLNLGCPSGTVTAKGKGSGMLRDLDALDSFLYEIYQAAPLPISVKTRIGFSDPEEFPNLLEIFNRYPICQLTVHPRVRAAFYKGTVDRQAFAYAQAHSRAPLCYNGDITSLSQAQELTGVDAVMIGRGLIGDPGMLCGGTKPEVLVQFHTELLQAYIAEFGGPRNAMFRMKEHWSYLLPGFGQNEKLAKQLRKCTDVTEFSRITQEIFHTLPWIR